MTTFNLRESVATSRDPVIRLMCPSGKALDLMRRTVVTHVFGWADFCDRLAGVVPEASVPAIAPETGG